MLPAVTVTTAHAANSKDITQVGSVDVTSVTDPSGKEFNGVRTDGTKITNGIDMAANGQRVVVNLRGTINDAGALSKGDTVTIPYSTVDGSHYPIPSLQGPSQLKNSAGTALFDLSYARQEITLTRTASPAAGRFDFNWSSASTGAWQDPSSFPSAGTLSPFPSSWV